jgi:hypothetical protein
LKRHSRDLEAFGQRFNLFGLDEGTLYVVLMSSAHEGSILTMTLAFGFTIANLVPDFEGVELPTIFAGNLPSEPTRRVSRYERPWVI